MSDKPDLLKAGELVRLIPVVADSSKEKRALSVFLAALMSVDEFRSVMLRSLGVRAGSRATLQAFTECTFAGHDADAERPDGLVVLSTGKKQWRALVEAKIGNSSLEHAQVERYATLARTLEVDALITISNQFVALPTHHPVRLSKLLTKRVDLFHWSWIFVVTQASLVLSSNEVASNEQRYILEEALRYWRHDSAGISTFDRMSREWKDLVVKVRNRAALDKASQEVEITIGNWHQEVRDLCLLMTRRLGRNVRVCLPKAHRDSPGQRVHDDIDHLVKAETLQCEFDIPDAAAPLKVIADLATRTIRCAMLLQAPADKKRTSARVNWLVRQLDKADPEGTYVKAIRRGRSQETEQLLAVLRSDPNALDSPKTDVPPTAFEIYTIQDLGGRFAGQKTFIEEIEKLVPQFYEYVGQHLRAWVPPPPKISTRDPVREPDEPELPRDIPDVSPKIQVDHRVHDVNTEESQPRAAVLPPSLPPHDSL